MPQWRVSLEHLPLLSEVDGIVELSDDQCIEGLEGTVHYIGSRHNFASLGPVYLLAFSGPDDDRQKLINEISRELGLPFETKTNYYLDIWYVYWRDRRSTC